MHNSDGKSDGWAILTYSLHRRHFPTDTGFTVFSVPLIYGEKKEGYKARRLLQTRYARLLQMVFA